MTPATRKILTRHNASPVTEFAYYAPGIPMPILCRLLQRSKRTITEWLNGTRIIPTWAVAVLRLQTLEHELKLDEMGVTRDLDEPATDDHRRGPAANEDICEQPEIRPSLEWTAKTPLIPAASTPDTGQASHRRAWPPQTRSSAHARGHRSTYGLSTSP